MILHNKCHIHAVQWNLDLRKPDLRKNLDLRKIVATTDFLVHTLYNAILRIARNFLETRENIKISTHPFYLQYSKGQ